AEDGIRDWSVTGVQTCALPICILAAIVVPKFANRGEQARQTAAKTQIGAFSTALSAFEVDNGYYPRGKDGLQALLVRPNDANNRSEERRVGKERRNGGSEDT